MLVHAQDMHVHTMGYAHSHNGICLFTPRICLFSSHPGYAGSRSGICLFTPRICLFIPRICTFTAEYASAHNTANLNKYLTQLGLHDFTDVCNSLKCCSLYLPTSISEDEPTGAHCHLWIVNIVVCVACYGCDM